MPSPVKSLRNTISYIKENKKKFFWLWIGYQTIKGLTTLTLIWIPLWLAWRGFGGA